MLPGIELHHEALDGRGYPYGLKDDQVPLLARVIAVADTFDALTTNRPYQHAHTPEEALGIIRDLAGKRLDPKAVDAIIAVYGRGEIRIQRLPVRTAVQPAPANAAATPSTQPAVTPVAVTATASLAVDSAADEKVRV
jgi:HD-GYP domain-containing protein (c-di-GMP phosphodiesterase class II)